MKNKAWTKSFLSSLIAILCGLIFGLLIMFLVIPNQALEGFSILETGWQRAVCGPIGSN